MDNVKTMRLFLTVVQIGSLSGAGRQSGLSPASVSRQITALEDDLGVRLLNRTSRRLSLTEAGQVYLERAERLLQDIDELRDAVTQLAVRPRGTLRIQSRVTLGTQYVAPLIPAFMAQYPDLKIDLWLTDTDLDLTEHGIDLAIRTGDLADSTLIARRLASSPRVVCASPQYWAQHGRPARPEDVMAHNCLTYRFEFGTAAALWQFRSDEGRSINLQVGGNFQTNNGQALRLATLSGLGIALLPAWSVKNHLQAGTLERVLSEYETTVSDLDFGIYAVYLSRRNLSLKTRLFIDHLVAEFSKQDWT
ncbi:MAG: LysR substrate-binding domain-containing protein [Pseudomonadales bacterium]|jgi:DNA-binding transcriptional LysR family regulator|nr:LysR substrate-binding domain-containing protein [Pseudomonadales bacterium]